MSLWLLGHSCYLLLLVKHHVHHLLMVLLEGLLLHQNHLLVVHVLLLKGHPCELLLGHCGHLRHHLRHHWHLGHLRHLGHLGLDSRLSALLRGLCLLLLGGSLSAIEVHLLLFFLIFLLHLLLVFLLLALLGSHLLLRLLSLGGWLSHGLLSGLLLDFRSVLHLGLLDGRAFLLLGLAGLLLALSSLFLSFLGVLLSLLELLGLLLAELGLLISLGRINLYLLLNLVKEFLDFVVDVVLRLLLLLLLPQGTLGSLLLALLSTLLGLSISLRISFSSVLNSLLLFEFLFFFLASRSFLLKLGGHFLLDLLGEELSAALAILLLQGLGLVPLIALNAFVLVLNLVLLEGLANHNGVKIVFNTKRCYIIVLKKIKFCV